MHFLCPALQPCHRLLGAALELLGQEPPQQPSPPPGREREVSPKTDSAPLRPQRGHGDGLVIDDAEWHPDQHVEPVRGRIHLEHFPAETELGPPIRDSPRAVVLLHHGGNLLSVGGLEAGKTGTRQSIIC